MGSMAPIVRDTWEARHVPKALWGRLRADPVRAPEHLALAASEVHGPAAAEWARRTRPGKEGHGRDLARGVVRRHVRFARVSGGATGLGGWTTMVADLASLAWIETRMVFFVAAAFGWDATDPMRPAELLVLQGVYDDPYVARAALDGTGTTVAETYIGNLGQRDRKLAQRLFVLVGAHGVRKLGGRAIPGFAIAVNSFANAADTKDLGRRAVTFYGGPG